MSKSPQVTERIVASASPWSAITGYPAVSAFASKFIMLLLLRRVTRESRGSSWMTSSSDDVGDGPIHAQTDRMLWAQPSRWTMPVVVTMVSLPPLSRVEGQAGDKRVVALAEGGDLVPTDHGRR